MDVIDFLVTILGLNPGLEMEFPQTQKSSISVHAGIGYGGSYRKLTTGFESGFQVLIAPFLDAQYRHYIGIEKKEKKGRT